MNIGMHTGPHRVLYYSYIVDGYRDRSFYLGLVSLVWMIASGIGPVLGGVLSEKASWRWYRWINLPCSEIAFVVLLLFPQLPTSGQTTSSGLKSVD